MSSPHYPNVVVSGATVNQPTHLVISDVTRAMLNDRSIPMEAMESFCDEVGAPNADIDTVVRTWVTVSD